MADMKFLELLSKEFPNINAATSEIINLRSILALPKGTEYFLSDLHGEYDIFVHILKTASGTIKNKIDENYGFSLTDADREELASLIYDPEYIIKKKKATEANFDQWCKTTIYRLITICKAVSNKYTRNKVHKMLPEYLGKSIDELLHANDEQNKAQYYDSIISTIVECGLGELYIKEIAQLTSTLSIDQLHIIGDVFDRGPKTDKIFEYLMTHHQVDFQWGNHDILWMGGAAGNWPCLTNMLRINIRYNNFDMLEVAYGINLRPLASFAEKIYGDDPCEYFKPNMLDVNIYDQVDEKLAAKMHKAIAIIQFKVEGQAIMAHPEYNMNDRLFLDKIDWEKGTVMVDGKEYPMRDMNLPTVDRNDPYKLTDEEYELMCSIEASVMNCEKLQKHIRFMFNRGELYSVINGNLLFHGCIPMTADGEFEEVTINGETHSGKALMDFLDGEIRKAFFSRETQAERAKKADIMWYLWLSGQSPLFGKEKMTTFERLFIADKATHKEKTSPYYSLIKEKAPCEKILKEFGLDPERSKIINGHVPVKLKDGESPIKGGGLLYVIDGGMSKAYQKQTGIAGYTFIFNSRFMALAEHKPYIISKEDGSKIFESPVMRTVETLQERMLNIDTDQSKHLLEHIEDMKALVEAYRSGKIKEKYNVPQY